MADVTNQLDLRCMNCKGETDKTNPKLYGTVWVCPSCHTVAQLFETRIDTELTYLRRIAKEAIISALAKGTLHLSTANTTDVPKRELLAEFLKLVKAHENG